MTGTAPRDLQLEEEIETTERHIRMYETEIRRCPPAKLATAWHRDRVRALEGARASLARLTARARRIVEQS